MSNALTYIAIPRPSPDAGKASVASGQSQYITRKRQAIEFVANVFSGGKQSGPTEAELKELHAQIGRLAAQNDFLL